MVPLATNGTIGKILMMQAAEKKSIPGFFNEAVYPTGKLRQLVCHGFPTCGSRPLVLGSGRWRQSLFQLVCTPRKLAAILSPGTRALLLHLSTGSDRYTDTTTIRDACCDSFSWHSGSSSAFRYRLRPLH